MGDFAAGLLALGIIILLNLVLWTGLIVGAVVLLRALEANI
jgi:hypothetical protein